MKYLKSKIVLAVLLLSLLPAGLFLSNASLCHYYKDSYYAELKDMVQYLKKAKGRRLVLIGGSNIAFGVDTELLQDTLEDYGYDFTVCPMGLYAAVGTSVMLDLTLPQLREGDVVIFSPEPTSETLSSYFGATAYWKCADEDLTLLLPCSKSKKQALVGNFVDYWQDKWQIKYSGILPEAEGVYAKSSFNEVCNMIYPREKNTMTLGFDASSPVDFSLISIEETFAEQFNRFYAQAVHQGAEVYLSFSPVNRSAIVDEDTLNEYFMLCNETFACTVISDPTRYVLDSGWFYDSNFHLNSSGAELRTVQLAQDILVSLGCYTRVSVPVPQMPSSIALSSSKDDSGDVYAFVFEEFNGELQITGLTEAGKQETTLRIPETFEGKAVVSVSSSALAGSSLRELTIPSSLLYLQDRVFAKCSSLERVVFEHTKNLCSITENTFAEAEQIRIFVPAESYHLYRDGDGCQTNAWDRLLNQIYTY